MANDKGWTMLAGEAADVMVGRYIVARTPKGTRPLHAELRAENEHMRLSLLTMAARERETTAERDALRAMLAEARGARCAPRQKAIEAGDPATEGALAEIEALALADACALGLDAVDVAVADVALFKAHYRPDGEVYR